MSGAPLVALRDVSLGYGDRPVLEHVTLEIADGEFLALLGPNGAGKTTLLRGLLGLIPVLRGEIAWSFDRTAAPPGYVPQREALDAVFPLSAEEVVVMGTYARLGPLRRVGARQRAVAHECLERVGLGTMRDQPFWTLSGGQKQRVLIARALATEPRILFLDEPTAGVDPGASATILDVLARLNADRRLTIVLVTHQLRPLRTLIHTAVWVDGGTASKAEVDELLSPERIVALFAGGAKPA